MKQLIKKPIGQLLVLTTLVVSQFVFAGDLIRPSGDPTIPTINSKTTLSTFSTLSDVSSISSITVDLVADDIMVNFNSPVGIATVSVYNSKSNLVYQIAVDTDNTAEVSIPVDFFKKGDYTVSVTYGSTVYTEQINL
ncbi:MAG: DUF3244 domain-containing protein [Paludibacter sp.]|nr:DUF3244 domain-containing protein [Paludibacter sp.]